MLIDWFTVGAQTLNFLILVWLLKRFLYQPILDAIDTREKGIAAQLADADAKKAEAGMEREQFQQKNAEFDQQRGALLLEATQQAQAERQRLLDVARGAADALRARQQDGLDQERQNLAEEITQRTQGEVFAIARKALADLAGVALEARMVEVFAQRLRALAGEARDTLGAALKAGSGYGAGSGSGPALVRSAFALTPAQRDALQQVLDDSFAAGLAAGVAEPIALRFETAPELVSGIELSANGQKFAWSIANYLGGLEESVSALLQGRPRGEVDAPAAGPSVMAPTGSDAMVPVVSVAVASASSGPVAPVSGDAVPPVSSAAVAPVSSVAVAPAGSAAAAAR